MSLYSIIQFLKPPCIQVFGSDVYKWETILYSLILSFAATFYSQICHQVSWNYLFLNTEVFQFIFLLNPSFQIHHLYFGQVLWVLRFIQFGERASLRERMPTSNYKLGKYSEWEKQWQQIKNVKKLTNITDNTKQKKLFSITLPSIPL